MALGIGLTCWTDDQIADAHLFGLFESKDDRTGYISGSERLGTFEGSFNEVWSILSRVVEVRSYHTWLDSRYSESLCCDFHPQRFSNSSSREFAAAVNSTPRRYDPSGYR